VGFQAGHPFYGPGLTAEARARGIANLQKPATELDHVYPESLGGPTLIDNLVPACGSCNKGKQDLTIDQWALTRRGLRLGIGVRFS